MMERHVPTDESDDDISMETASPDQTLQEIINQNTCKSFLLNEQVEYIIEKKQIGSSWNSVYSVGNMNIEGAIVPSPFERATSAQLELKNRVDIDALKKSNAVLNGKYFLCRVISAPVRLDNLTFIVDDPMGFHGVRIYLSNFLVSEEQLKAMFPIGTGLAVLDPCFQRMLNGGFAVVCESPQHILTVDDDLFQTTFELTWESEAPPDIDADEQDTEKIRMIGNELFKAQKFLEAGNVYNLGLKVDPNDIQLLSNRAAVYLTLRCFKSCVEDCEKILEADPNHVKAIFRKGSALLGMRKYLDGFTFLQQYSGALTVTTTAAVRANIGKLRCVANELYRQELSGEYNMNELLRLGKADTRLDQYAEYTGPVEVADIPLKGRGLIATDNISAGQLLIVSKALAIVFGKEITNFNFDKLTRFEKKIRRRENHYVMIRDLSERMLLEPSLGETLYNLYAGPEMQYLTEQEIVNGGNETKTLDVERISWILNYNSQSTRRVTLNSALGSTVIVTGLWTLPSLINHSCYDCNSTWLIIGDLMIIRAFKDIPRGQEILVTYLAAELPYEIRVKETKKIYGFTCCCSLCLTESSLTKDGIRQMRNLRNVVSDPGVQAGHYKKALDSMERLYEAYPRLNLQSIKPRVCYALRVAGMACPEHLMKAHALMKNTSMCGFAALFAMMIISKYLRSMVPEHQIVARRWVPKLQHDLICAYGSVLPAKVISESLWREFLQHGINLNYF